MCYGFPLPVSCPIEQIRFVIIAINDLFDDNGVGFKSLTGFKAAGTSSTTPGQRDHLLPSLPQNHQRCGLGSCRAYEAAELCPRVVGLTTFLRGHGKGKLINAENVPVLIPLLKNMLNYLEGLTFGEQMDC